MSQSSEEDLDEQIAYWNATYLPGIEEKEEAAAAAAAADEEKEKEKEKEKEIIDCDADEGDGKKRKDIPKRSSIWEHFTEIKDEHNVVIKGKCKYCVLQLKDGSKVETWNFDPESLRVKSKKGDDIGKHLQKVLLDWGLDKVMTVTVDNASANDSGINYLRRQMNNLKTNIALGKYLHMRCAAHIVNLIVQDGLKEVDISIKRVRALRIGGEWHDIVENENENDKGKAKGKEKEKENMNLLIFVAVVLDPRYKLSSIRNLSFKKFMVRVPDEKLWAAPNKCLHGMFEEYRASYSSDRTSQKSDSPQPTQGGGSTEMMKSVVAKRMRLNNGSSSYGRGTRTELDKYLAEECEDEVKTFDILAWWKGQSSRFPVLSRLARDVLAIPISTVASESAFSLSGRILDDFRTSLTPFMVEALVCTNDWVRRTTPINVAENTEELSKLEEGDSINHLFYLLFVLTNKLFIAFISVILELIQEFKDKEINENNASKAQVLGSKSKSKATTTTTSTGTNSQSKQSSKTSKSKQSNSKAT
ncbi:hypothetical protein U9M48_027394 [Paspalum notatum var. saurae]|uniref:HAT C-terminal dimerisation domain-containing protein n=1 Tax=Paspalum notatum var. saurae TaxID=547442 RepID=A0AAQ3X019_PASNO